MRAMSLSLNEKISIPPMKSLPKLGLSRAPKMFNKVDFPLPEGPTIDTNSPLCTDILILLRATTLPAAESKTLERFSTANVASEETSK
jgi:hypothetical protein